MNLVVLAQTPPPLHGQSVMVEVLVNGLAQRPGFTLHHVNFRLSHDSADIGRWRARKMVQTLRHALHAVAVRLRHGCDTLYYVPSPPGKRGALYRDWIALAICRPFFRRTVLHWHAVGLGAWLQTDASVPERLITRLLLGRAHLAIVLGKALQDDARVLRARRIAVVPNGVPDPSPPTAALIPGLGACQALFLGLCSEEKGLFAAAEAVLAANRDTHAPADHPHFTLVAAGPFADAATAEKFRAFARTHPATLRHIGFAGPAEKNILFTESRCLLFPTRYPAEGLPLVVLEALAHDLPVVATKWRALPDVVTSECGQLVDPGDTSALVAALISLRAAPPAPGACRTRFLREFTLAQHLDTLAAALASISTPEASAQAQR